MHPCCFGILPMLQVFGGLLYYFVLPEAHHSSIQRFGILTSHKYVLTTAMVLSRKFLINHKRADHIYICICTYLYVYVCTYMYTYIHIYIYVHIYSYTYIYIYIYVHIYIYSCTCVWIYTYVARLNVYICCNLAWICHNINGMVQSRRISTYVSSKCISLNWNILEFPFSFLSFPFASATVRSAAGGGVAGRALGVGLREKVEEVHILESLLASEFTL